MILDTTFLIDVLRGTQTVQSLVSELDTSGTPFVSSVTIMELAEGIRLADATDAEREQVTDLLTDVRELPFDRDCAMRAGAIGAELVRTGERVEQTDVMIAATALVADRPVVTRNVEHFERIDGIDVVSY